MVVRSTPPSHLGYRDSQVAEKSLPGVILSRDPFSGCAVYSKAHESGASGACHHGAHTWPAQLHVKLSLVVAGYFTR